MNDLDKKICLYQAEKVSLITEYERDIMLEYLNIVSRYKKKKAEKEKHRLEEMKQKEIKVKELGKEIQKYGIDFLKKYTSTKQFREKYSDFLYLISIKPTNYGDVCSIEISKTQDGIDWNKVDKWEKLHEDEFDNDDDLDKANPYYDNKWYTELLRVGSAAIKSKYKDEIKKYGLTIHTGDGDECQIYIDYSED